MRLHPFQRQRSFGLLVGFLLLPGLAAAAAPRPPGKMVDLGGHRLHVDCRGRGAPTVVVENGLGDFSFDWVLVQSKVAAQTRMCTYDRAGYAWSDPGPLPRTFDQLNFELREALSKLGEKPPFVLVGHSFGGPVIRNFAALHPSEVSGMVLVDSVFENQRVAIQGKAVRLRDGATGKPVPPPGRDMKARAMKAKDGPSHPVAGEEAARSATSSLDPLYRRLPPREQEYQVWAQSLPELGDAESSQREWSTEYFARLYANPSAGALGAIPLAVLSRALGGYSDNLDVPASELESERLAGQAGLARLSSRGRQIILPCGHNMELEAPDEVATEILRVVDEVRKTSGDSRSR